MTRYGTGIPNSKLPAPFAAMESHGEALLTEGVAGPPVVKVLEADPLGGT